MAPVDAVRRRLDRGQPNQFSGPTGPRQNLPGQEPGFMAPWQGGFNPNMGGHPNPYGNMNNAQQGHFTGVNHPNFNGPGQHGQNQQQPGNPYMHYLDPQAMMELAQAQQGIGNVRDQYNEQRKDIVQQTRGALNAQNDANRMQTSDFNEQAAASGLGRSSASMLDLGNMLTGQQQAIGDIRFGKRQGIQDALAQKQEALNQLRMGKTQSRTGALMRLAGQYTNPFATSMGGGY